MDHHQVEYIPGRMLLFSGDQLHAVGPYKDPTSSDRRIVSRHPLYGFGTFDGSAPRFCPLFLAGVRDLGAGPCSAICMDGSGLKSALV